VGSSSKNRHLVLAINPEGLGEAMLGLTLARELQNAGGEIFFLAHRANARLLEVNFPCFTFDSLASVFLQFYLQSCAKDFQPSSIVLADYIATRRYFATLGLPSSIVTSLGLPIFAIDTWNSACSSEDMDLFISTFDRSDPLWPTVVPICPVPFLAPDGAGRFYRSLPDCADVNQAARQQLRADLGVGEQDRIVIFCTAEWQHLEDSSRRRGMRSSYEREWSDGRRLATSLPSLLADYLSRIGPTVHLLHVGPHAYDLSECMSGHYHWMPPQPERQFQCLLAAADLLVSANISATTITTAMVLGVPTLVLQNTILARTPEELKEAMGYPLSARLKKWLDKAVPLFPFAMWPLGCRQFLAPRLRHNPYLDALDTVELTDERRVEHALSLLLYDTTAREEQAHRRAIYFSRVRALPTGAELMDLCPV
jgi:hypothetical protein